MAALDPVRAVAGPGIDRAFNEVQKGYTIFRDGDLLVARITPCFENNKIGQARLAHEIGVGSTEFHVIRPNLSRLHDRYLLHFLRQRSVLRAGQRRMTGSAGQRRVPVAFLEALRIPLPSIEEQRRIAAVLDQADALRAKRRQVLARLDDLAQSILRVTLASLDAGSVPLREWVVDFRYGTSNSSGSTGEPTLRIPNVIGGGLDFNDLKTVRVSAAEFGRLALEDGDLLFVRSNGNPNNVGRCALFDVKGVASTRHDPRRFIYASYLIRARLDNRQAEPIYLREFLLGPDGRRQLLERAKTSAGQYNINIDGLSSVEVPALPLSAQRHFAQQVEQVGSIAKYSRESLRKLDALFRAIQVRAFGAQH